MNEKSIEGLCPNGKKPMLMITGTMRDISDWQIKYTIECKLCGFRFKVDKKSLENILITSKKKKKMRKNE